MKNTKVKILITLALMALILPGLSFAQLKHSLLNKARPETRCGTMELVKKMLQQNPALKEQWKQNGISAYKNYMDGLIRNSVQGDFHTASTESKILIPVVVHIVLQDSIQALITDRDVQDQIEILNRDFSGISIDTNLLAPEFRKIAGHSSIQFALASRNPNGNFSSGIERLSTNKNFTSNNFNEVKTDTSGGLNAWDVTRYFNVWVANFSDGSLLGIATFPFMTPANEQGVCIHYQGWGTNPAYTYFPDNSGGRKYAYNLGRSLVHETGHYFYLFHIWGDDGGDCTGNDFDLEPGWPLPNSCTDDTPNESDHTFGLYAGYMRDNCSPVLPGFMYANFMDYSDDASLLAFTNGQVCRMEGALETYRTSLKTSDGIIAPPGTNDAALVSITPGERQDLAYPVVLPGHPIMVQIRNRGAQTLTSAQITVQINGSVSVIPWSGSLLPNESAWVVAGNSSGLSGTIKILAYISNPNGSTDMYHGNDTLTNFITVAASSILTAPVSESFDGIAFPPANWTRLNMIPAFAGGQWMRSAGVPGNSTHSGPGAMKVTNYANALSGQFNDLVTPAIDFGSADSSVLSFWVSHGAFGIDTLKNDYYNDGLEVDISTDSGLTYQAVYRKTSVPDLRTSFLYSGSTTPEYVPAGQWRQESINLTPYLANSKKILVRFRNINGNGNDIYIDDVNISAAHLPSYDIGVTSINASTRICAPLQTATLSITNHGINPITSATINYSVNNGSLSTINWTGNLQKGESATVPVTLNIANTGIYQFLAYTDQPNHTADENSGNDTLHYTITLVPTISLKNALTEGFDNTVFPPSGWTVLNPDNDLTWTRTSSYGKRSQGAAWYNDYRKTTQASIDDLSTPNLSYTFADSVFMNFQMATISRSNSGSTIAPLDTLSIMISRDCGNSFTTVYKKWGDSLQTINDPSSAHAFEFFPIASQWRKDSVNLGNFLGVSENQFMITFRLSSHQENNIFLDDINVYTKILPPALKQKGYVILPTVFNSQFAVWHYKAPADLAYINVFNAAGQLVWQQQYNGNANSFIVVDITGKAAGVYFVSLGYTDPKKNVSQQIIKN